MGRWTAATANPLNDPLSYCLHAHWLVSYVTLVRLSLVSVTQSKTPLGVAVRRSVGSHLLSVDFRERRFPLIMWAGSSNQLTAVRVKTGFPEKKFCLKAAASNPTWPAGLSYRFQTRQLLLSVSISSSLSSFLSVSLCLCLSLSLSICTQAYLGDIVGFVPDHCTGASIAINQVTQIFWFPHAYKSYIHIAL